MKHTLSILIFAIFNIAIQAQVKTTGSPSPVAVWLQFSYDASGNRVSRVIHLPSNRNASTTADTTQTPPDSLTSLSGRTQETDHLNNLAQQNPDHIANNSGSKTETVVESSSGNIGKTQNISSRIESGNDVNKSNSEHETPNTEYRTPNTEYKNTTNPSTPQTFTETLALGQSISIYPNPTNGALSVEISNLQNSVAMLQIVDVSGKQHYIKNKLVGREEINLSNAPAGIYFLRITLDGKMEEWKIIKQ